MALLRGKPVAGMMPPPIPGIPSNWTTYVCVADADEAAAKVQAAGGQVLQPPMDVFEFGRLAVFSDPVGAVFAIWQPRSHLGSGLANEPGAFTWNELMTTDVEASKTFYSTVFGWEASDESMPGFVYTQFEVAGRPVAGMMPRPPEVPAEVPPFWAVYFAIADTDAACDWISGHGGQVLMPPKDIPPGRFAVAADPQGATFSLITLADAG